MATVPTTSTWAAGSILTAAQLNTYVSTATNFFLSKPICQGRQTVVQSIPQISPTPITFDVEDVDNDNMHSPTTNPERITAQTAGRYILGGGLSFTSNSTGVRAAEWWLNGVLMNGGGVDLPPVSGNTTRLPARAISIYLNVGDYVTLDAFQTSGGSLSTAVSQQEQALALVQWIGNT